MRIILPGLQVGKLRPRDCDLVTATETVLEPGLEFLAVGQAASSGPSPSCVVLLLLAWLVLLVFGRVLKVLDEADRLLEQGCTDFTKDLEVILGAVPATRQTLLFSATLTDTLNELKSLAMNKPFFWESQAE